MMNPSLILGHLQRDCTVSFSALAVSKTLAASLELTCGDWPGR
jgi:hypothetical protein